MVKRSWPAGLVALPPMSPWAATPQGMVTRDFTVAIVEQCAQATVGCHNVLYTGVDRRNGKSLTLHGKTLVHDCAGTHTPCQLPGWRRDNRGGLYTVTSAGVLEAVRDGTELLPRAGRWRALDARSAAQPPAGPVASMQCELDDGRPQPCSMTGHVDRQPVHSMRFTLPARTLTFEGKSRTGWWSGEVDGKPAMGRALNRGHVVYRITNLGTAFRQWSPGMQHGSY